MSQRLWPRVIAIALVLLTTGCKDDDDDQTPDSGAVTDTGGEVGDAATADSSGAPADGSATGLKWYRTCGDPVCGPEPDGGVANACPSQQEGKACSQKDDSCNLSCGAKLICTDQPFDLSNCPISLRRYKRSIKYVSAEQRARLRDALLRLRLARYDYTAAAGGTKERLGFIIDDGVPREALSGDGDQVDLYGYASLIAAAVQAQARDVARLRAELRQLQAENARLKGRQR